MELMDATVVVTGASSGIGEATAQHLASRGANLVLAARREDRLVKLAEEIAADGGRALPVPADVSSVDDLERLREESLRAYGSVDALVNNAGVPGPGPLARATVEEIDQCIDVNFRSVVHATRAFLPVFLDAKRGHVVNVASLAGRYATPTAAVYSATKHAVVAFSESLYYELEPYGVKVTSVNPGFVSTEGFPNNQVPELLLMKPEKIAQGIATVIERGIAPEFSIPKWMAPFQAVRVLAPPLYRAGVKAMMQRELRRQGAHPSVADDPRE